jgi:hypothetical protein
LALLAPSFVCINAPSILFSYDLFLLILFKLICFFKYVLSNNS